MSSAHWLLTAGLWLFRKSARVHMRMYDGSFDGLRDITGNLTHFTVTTDGRRPDKICY